MTPSVTKVRPTKFALLATLVALAAAYALLARFGLDAFPASGDEHSYLLQGEIFASGHLSVPAPAHAEIFQVDHVVFDHAVRSKYPPGWPALLALGWLVHAPWIVNPIVGALALALVFGATKRLHGEEAAWAATLMLGLSPFFALNCASFHSHPAALLAEAAYAYAVVRGALGRDRPSAAWGAIGGIALGWLFVTRPGDAAVCAVAILAFYRAPKFVLACALGAAAVASLFFAYNALQFGSPFRSGYAAFDPVSRELYGEASTVPASPRFLVDPNAQWYHLGWLVDLAAWLVPAMTVLALLGLARPPENGQIRGFVRALAVFPLLFVLSMSSELGDAYGPRYLFPLLLPMALAAGGAWTRVRAWIGEHPRLSEVPEKRQTKYFALALAAALAVGAVKIGMYTEHHHVDNAHRAALYRRVEGMHLPRSVVIVHADAPTYYARNLADFDGPVIYVSPRGKTDDEVASYFPDREAYAATQAAGGTDWTIARVR